MTEVVEAVPGPVNPWRTVTRWLLILNIAIFVIDYFVIRQARTLVIDGSPLFVPQPLLAYFGHFSVYFVFQKFELWRFFTYQFVHANLEHIVVNMLGLLLAGPLVEERLGRVRYLVFYLLCGACGPIAHLVLSFLGLTPVGLFTPLVGASASIYGVLVAAARIAPNEIVMLAFPPIDVRLKTLVWVLVGLSAVAVLWNFSNAGGHAAHLGGAVMGWYLAYRMIPHPPADDPA